VGYSGSGWLILFFTGVTAVLKELGIISNTTRLAGSSGGSASAAATCAGIHPVQQYHSLKGMADYCRPSGGCRGFLDSVVTKQLHTILPLDAPQLCSGRLYTAVTTARPNGEPDPHMLLGGEWSNMDQLVSAVAASCYLPSLSGPAATTKLQWHPEAGAVYDGGFSHRLPCPPGVDQCITIAAQAKVPGLNPVQDMSDFIDLLNAGMAANASVDDHHTTPYLPLNPDMIFPNSVDIFPGLSGPLAVEPHVWNTFALALPDAATLQYLRHGQA